MINRSSALARNAQGRPQAPNCGLSLAQLVTAKFDAKRGAGDPPGKIASLSDLVKAFA